MRSSSCLQILPLVDLPSPVQAHRYHLSWIEVNSEVELTLLAPSQHTCWTAFLASL